MLADLNVNTAERMLFSAWAGHALLFGRPGAVHGFHASQCNDARRLWWAILGKWGSAKCRCGLDLKCLGQCTSMLTDSSALGMCRVVVQDMPEKRGLRSNQLGWRAPWAKPEAVWLGMHSLWYGTCLGSPASAMWRAWTGFSPHGAATTAACTSPGEPSLFHDKRLSGWGTRLPLQQTV